ncbi:hypothetical protein M9458_055407, partial [Cirrhinus mrigala]
MSLRPCASLCGSFLASLDGHDRCLTCLGREHTEAAFTDGSCVHCERMTMAASKSRLSFARRLPSSSSRGKSLSRQGFSAAAVRHLGDLQVTVENVPSASKAPRTSVSPRGPVELPKQYTSPLAGPSVSFGAPQEVEMSASASEGESEGEADVLAEQRPSAVAVPSEADAELSAMLFQAAREIGLEVPKTPPADPSRLDDWYLGRSSAATPRSPPVPEVYEELVRTWQAPHSSRPRPSSSPLATLDGGAAKGYVAVPQVERAVAVHLCPRGAATWRDRPHLPSKACKLSSALAGRAYHAAGHAATALHAMATLQVYQAKALKYLHEGGLDQGAMQELCAATDESDGTFPWPGDVHTSGSGATPMVNPGPDGRRRQSMLSRRSHLPGSRRRRSNTSSLAVTLPPCPRGLNLRLPVAEGAPLRLQNHRLFPPLRHTMPDWRPDGVDEPAAGEGHRPPLRDRPGTPAEELRSVPDAGTPEVQEIALGGMTTSTSPIPVEGRKPLCIQTLPSAHGSTVPTNSQKELIFSPLGLRPRVPVSSNALLPRIRTRRSILPAREPGKKKERRVKTHPGSSSPESVPSQAAVQDAHDEAHINMHSLPGLVRSHRPEGRVLSRLDSTPTQTLPTVCFRGSSVSVQSASIWPVPLSPCLYEGHGSCLIPPLADGHSHAQLSRRLASHSSLARCVVRTQGPGAPAPQPFGPSGQPREEQTLPSAEDLFSRCGAGLGQHDSPPHQQARTVSAELSELIQTQNSGSSQNISEAPGAYGSCSRGDATGLASYETASALVTRSSPEMGMAPWHTPDWHFPAVSPPVQPVVRPGLSSGRSPSGTSLQASCGLHGCLFHGLGCCMQRASSLGLLDRTSTAMAYQLPRVVGCASCAASLPTDAAPQARACSHRQHCDRSLYQPPRWSSLPSHVTTRPPSAPVESDVAEIATCRSHSRRTQPCSRPALTAVHPSWRMATPPPGSPADLEPFRQSPDRSVRFPRILPLPAILLPQRGSPQQGCTGTQLASGVQVRLSPSEPPCTDTVQDQGGRGAGSAGCAILAHPDLVSRPRFPCGSPSLEDPLEERSSFSGDGHNLAPASRPLEPARLAPGRDASDLSGLSQAVIDTISQSRAPSTRQAYALRWGLFVDWCSSRREDPQRCPIAVVLSFLQEKLERRLSPSTLKVYVAAIAAYHDAVDGASLGKHQLVVRFLRGARRVNPPRPHLIPSWDLSVTLRGLREAPFEPLASVELKYLSLKTALLTTLTSIKRVPTTPFRDQVVNLQALPLEEADPASALLCPVRALRIYVDRTRHFRRTEQLFVCFGGQQKGNAVSKQRLAHWVVDAISLSYQNQGEPCPLGVRAHSTRSVASSYALAHGASLADICRAAGWATPNTFARFYNLRVEAV